MSFPFDFGYVPSTSAEDGDPLDVLVLMDEPAFPGATYRVVATHGPSTARRLVKQGVAAAGKSD